MSKGRMFYQYINLTKKTDNSIEVRDIKSSILIGMIRLIPEQGEFVFQPYYGIGHISLDIMREIIRYIELLYSCGNKT